MTELLEEEGEHLGAEGEGLVVGIASAMAAGFFEAQ